uniref:Ribonuclease H-like domain-containing protein n=1 Tax=Tanacetum cinerariifolium TaxID=118510 RepID=A0A6L2MZK0_TANCI|nr:ribonuclease H-like domain-containing protein [Tanacetum cinerariifolium]
MVSSIKLPILKKGEYILWTMKIEQYLAHTDYALWEVILNDEHLARFHGIKDVKTLWAAIKTKFGGNAESKKMQKNVLKQQFKVFLVSNSEGLDKGYDRFQRLLSLLEIHGAESTSSTNELMLLIVFLLLHAIVLRHKDLEQIDQDDLEEMDLKWQVAMLSMRVKLFYKKTGRKLEFNGKELVGFDKTKVECFNYHRRGYFARYCRTIKNPGNIGRDARNAGYKGRDNGKRPAREEDEKALVVQDGLSTYDWSYQVEEEVTDFAFMAFTSNPLSSSSSNSEGTGHKESRPVWNNVQRINHQNKFAPTTVFTRFGRIPVSVAKPKAAASTSAAKPVNTAVPKHSVNFSNLISTFHKSHSPIRRSFYNATTHSRSNSTERVNTAGSKAVSAVKGNGVTAIKASAGCIWRPRVNEIDQISKDNRWICTRIDYGHPQQAINNKEIVNNGCARYMIGNKAYLADYQEIHDGGFVSFGSSRGKAKQSTCKAKLVSSISKPLQMLHMDLFGPISVMSINHKKYYLVVTDDFSRFSWVFFLATKDKTSKAKFEGKADDGFLVGYSVTSKAFRVFNTKSRIVEKKLHVRFLENKSNVARTGPNWIFDIDSLTNSMNYIPVTARNQTDKNAGPQDTNGNLTDSFSKKFKQGCMDQRGAATTGSTNSFNSISNLVNATSTSGTFSVVGPSSPHPDAFIPNDMLLLVDQDDSQIPDLEDTAEL